MSNFILYLGIDVSKLTLDLACTIDGQTIFTSRSVENNLSGFKTAFEWANKHAQKQKCTSIHVCIEATGRYSEEVMVFFQQLSLKVSLINPAQVKSFGKSIMLRTKTDKVDAQLIALYSAKMQPPATPKLPEELIELKKLVRHLDSLIKQRAQQKTRLESATHSIIINSINESITHFNKQIKEIEKLIKDHVTKYPLLQKNIDLLTSIQGIGEKTARILLCELYPQEQGHIDAKAQTAHAGLAPSQKQSGTSVHGKSAICKAGNSYLRNCLYLPALVATRHNSVINEFYNRLLAKSKPKKVALIACMRKLLVISIGVLNNNTSFDPNWSKQN